MTVVTGFSLGVATLSLVLYFWQRHKTRKAEQERSLWEMHAQGWEAKNKLAEEVNEGLTILLDKRNEEITRLRAYLPPDKRFRLLFPVPDTD